MVANVSKVFRPKFNIVHILLPRQITFIGIRPELFQSYFAWSAVFLDPEI